MQVKRFIHNEYADMLFILTKYIYSFFIYYYCDSMKKTFLFLLIALFFAVIISGCVQPEVEDVTESEDIRIGALLPLTGELSSIGEASQVSLEVSERDINNYFSSLNSDKNLEVVFRDTGSDPETALEMLKELDELGIDIIIGPQASGEAEAVLEYANSNGLVLLSIASTAPSLAIPDDNLFRLAPDDTNQAMVLFTFMQESNISTLVPMYRNDVWGNGLVEAVAEEFETIDGTITEGVSYENNDLELDAAVDQLNAKVVAASDDNEGQVAVLLCSYGEATEILKLSGKYPALTEVKWYGTDGIALNDALVNDVQAAEFAVTVDLKAPVYGQMLANDLYQKVQPSIEKQLGRPPESYALTAYDALWLSTFVCLDSIPDDDASIKLAMETLSDTYFGVSDWMILDENGDRKYWNYDIWTINEVSDGYKWQRCGKVILPFDNNMLILKGEELSFAQ